MSWLILFIKLLHIVGGLLMMAGLIGRGLTRIQAGKAKNLHDFEILMQVAGRFEKLLVIPSSNLVLVLGLISAWLQGWPLLGFLQGASSNWLLVSTLLYLTMIPMIIFIFIPRGKRFEAAFQTALAQGEMTVELKERFEDKVIHLAHQVEIVVIVVILYLMVMKPF
jgi:uncharacterized membrane protein